MHSKKVDFYNLMWNPQKNWITKERLKIFRRMEIKGHKDKCTLTMLAASRGQLSIIRFFIEQGIVSHEEICSDTMPVSGLTVLLLALLDDHVNVVNYLLDNKIVEEKHIQFQTTNLGLNSLHVAIQEKSEKCAELMLSKFPALVLDSTLQKAINETLCLNNLYNNGTNNLQNLDSKQNYMNTAYPFGRNLQQLP